MILLSMLTRYASKPVSDDLMARESDFAPRPPRQSKMPPVDPRRIGFVPHCKPRGRTFMLMAAGR